MSSSHNRPRSTRAARCRVPRPRHATAPPPPRGSAGQAPGAGDVARGPEGGAGIVFRGDSGNAKKIAKRAADYRRRFANPFIAGHRGYIDDVIFPRHTRARICRSLNMLKNKKLENPWKKHGNIPL